MRSPLLLLLLALPFIEIAGFVLVGRQIGVLPTVGLVLATGIVGSILLRVQGFGVLSRIQRAVQAKQNPGREVAHGIMILIAGVLLLIPGFFTDMIGILLFLPPVRDLAWRFLQARIAVVATSRGFAAGFGGRGREPSRGNTIDLDAEDYSATTPDPSPWRRIDRD